MARKKNLPVSPGDIVKVSVHGEADWFGEVTWMGRDKDGGWLYDVQEENGGMVRRLSSSRGDAIYFRAPSWDTLDALGRNPARKRNPIQMLGEAQSNPAHRNPWEVRSDSGLEGVFADEDDARFYAEEIRGSGGLGVVVERRQRRPLPASIRSVVPALNPSSRLFSGVYPTGIVYADRAREVDGDYARVAFLPFSTLMLQWSPGPQPAELREQIERDAALIIARRGEPFEVSSSGQTVILGGGPRQRPLGAPPQYHAPMGRPPGVPNPSLGDKYVLGTWGEGSRVQFGEWTFPSYQPSGVMMPGEWVTVVYNHADTNGVVGVKPDRTGGVLERDGRYPLVEVDPVRSVRLHAKRKHNPPNVLPVPGQAIRSWDYGAGHLVRICEEGTDGEYTATINLANGAAVSVPLKRTEYDFTARKNLERRTGFSRHEQFVGPPRPDRMPKGSPMPMPMPMSTQPDDIDDIDDTIVGKRRT